uniref:Interleukin-17 receptor E n=1 Tax=Aotus nancymaae TaxID=37293 RepID=A0A2K5CM83_AOTNA
MLAPFLLLLSHSRSPLSFRPCSHVPGKPMGSSRPAALLLPLLIFIDLSDSAGIGCSHLPHWNTRGRLASHMVRWAPAWHSHKALCSPACLQRGFFGLLVQKSKKSFTFKFCRKHKIPAPAQRKLLRSHRLSEKSHHMSIPSPDISHKGFRSKRTQPSDPEAWKSLPRLESQRHRGPEFSFDLLHEARAIRVTIPSGPEVSVRLCHQWALQCEELSNGSDFWKSVHFTDYSQHTQMVMALTLRCPLKLEAALCQRHNWHTVCKDFPNATAQESEGWYVLEKVDLHPQLCFKFSFGNSNHVECPHQTGSLTSWNVSMDTQTGQDPPPWGQPFCSLFLQAQGSSPVTLDLIIPFLRPGRCVLVWRSDVQFAWKHLLCPDVSNRHLGLLILGPVRPVLLLHAADSEAQRRLVGALAELLRAALGGGRDVIVDLWEGSHVARVGSLPWLWAARERVAREQGTVLLLWSSAGLCPASDPSLRTAPLLALLHAAPRPLLLLAYFSRLCAKGDIPQPLRALPRYRLLRDLPRLLRALDSQSSAEATSWGLLGVRQRWRSRLELCSRLEREVAQLADLG